VDRQRVYQLTIEPLAVGQLVFRGYPAIWIAGLQQYEIEVENLTASILGRDIFTAE